MNVVVNDIGTVISSMRGTFDQTFDSTFDQSLLPFYIYGHREEISNRLLEKDKDKVFKYQKYPLIALRLDTPELIEDGYQRYDLNIVILAATSAKYNAEQRYASTFVNTLYPIYISFLTKLRDSGLFVWDTSDDNEYPKHTKIDRPFWGTTSGEANDGYIFNDPLDAIEILNLKIQSRIKCRW